MKTKTIIFTFYLLLGCLNPKIDYKASIVNNSNSNDNKGKVSAKIEKSLNKIKKQTEVRRMDRNNYPKQTIISSLSCSIPT